MNFKEVGFEEFPETWTPELGDEFIGTVREIKEVTVDNKTRHLAIMEARPDGKLYTVWLNGVLRGKFNSGKVTEGTVVKIVFDGKKQSPVSKFMYNDYRLFVSE